MKLVICSVLDTVAGVYSRPFCARSDAEAQRIFLMMCEKDETVSRCPSDYRLYILGSFDEVEGSVEGCRPRQVAAGAGDGGERPEGQSRGAFRRLLRRSS